MKKYIIILGLIIATISCSKEDVERFSSQRQLFLTMEKAKNLETKKEKVIWNTPTNINFGKIIDIRFKTQYGNDWN